MSNTFACSVDLGTMNIVSARDSIDGKNVIINSIRDCYREISYADEFETLLKNQKTAYIRDGDKLYILGDDAYIQTSMAEFAQGQSGDTSEILKRPMKDGVLNQDSPKLSMTILRELMKSCLEKEIGTARKGEILYVTVPANPVDSSINNVFHEKTAVRFLSSLGYDVHVLGEASAIIFAENPVMTTPNGNIPYSGIGLSCGSGMCNFCLAQRGVTIDEFSVCRGGDYLDTQVAKATGQPRTKVMRVKEKSLDFNSLDEGNEILLALDIYYDEMINHVFKCFAERFAKNKGKLEYPIEIVLAGGTATPKGFEKKVKTVLSRMDLPFEISRIRLAGDGDPKKMLTSVARGAYLRAKNTANKLANTKDVLDILGK